MRRIYKWTNCRVVSEREREKERKKEKERKSEFVGSSEGSELLVFVLFVRKDRVTVMLCYVML